MYPKNVRRIRANDTAIKDLSPRNRRITQGNPREKSFLNVYTTPGKTGEPETSTLPKTHIVMGGSVLILVFALFALLYSTSKVRIGRYLSAVFSTRRFKEYVAEEGLSLFPSMPLMYLIQSILVGSVISYWILSQTDVTKPIQLVGITGLIIVGYALIPLLRSGLIMMMGNIFMIQYEARKHIFISYLSHTVLCLLLLPLAVQLAVYLPFINIYFTWILLICFGLTLLYQLVKMLQNTPLPDAGALIYIFLYFCTLEILPLVLMYKVVSIYA